MQIAFPLHLVYSGPMNTQAIAAEVRAEIARLQKVLDLLEGSASRGGRGRIKRKLSKDARERIAEAQRKRWAKLRKQKKAA